MESYEPISLEEIEECSSTLEQFATNSKPGIIVLEDGKIYEVNNAIKFRNPILRTLIGQDISHTLKLMKEDTEEFVANLEQVTEGKYVIEIDATKQRFFIEL